MSNYCNTFSIRRLWIIFLITMTIMFSILIYFGGRIYQLAPPIPSSVETSSGKIIFTKEDILYGQNIWQSTGGMQQGSIWGHGSYLAPDWSADWLHREANALLNLITFDTDDAMLARYKYELKTEMRKNTYDPNTDKIIISENRSKAIDQVSKHFSGLYKNISPQTQKLRESYSFPTDAVLDGPQAHAITAFFFWTAWGAVTNRPNDTISYTSNWPYDPLVGNVPSASVLMWSIISIFMLLAGIGALVWYYAKEYNVWQSDIEPKDGFAQEDVIESVTITPSMRATKKFFILTAVLFSMQVLLGIITAHYSIEGQGFYNLPLVKYFPYVITRTWHTQLSVLWIATAWLATGLYMAPLLSGKEPKFQKFGVNFLFYSLLLIVGGSFIGQWLAVHRFIPDMVVNFWLGHQGYEYVDLGRFWQIYLFVGLMLWVVLVMRGLKPILDKSNIKSLAYLVFIATTAIGLLYGAGLMWGQHTHISVVEYWRWWVVHLWVEGVFEVFATAIISTVFVHMGLLRASVATTMVLLATLIFLGAGVLGMFHHLYWSGTPISVMAIGATFSALEVVPLAVIGFEAYNHAKIEKRSSWEAAYYWAFKFFMAVLFWNLVGAGLFGFLINPPIALYYMQGLYTTANHAHAALFGVYGMLGIGLLLFCLRGLTDVNNWNQKHLKISFWCLNIGLGMMTLFSLFPQGLWQTYNSIKYHYAYVRSADFIHSPIMENLVWMRVPGDIVFSIGVVFFVTFMFNACRQRTKVFTYT